MYLTIKANNEFIKQLMLIRSFTCTYIQIHTMKTSVLINKCVTKFITPAQVERRTNAPEVYGQELNFGWYSGNAVNAKHSGEWNYNLHV